MKIDSVSSISYKSHAEKSFITKRTQENAGKSLELMSRDTVCRENQAGNSMIVNVLASLKLAKDVKFSDERIYLSSRSIKDGIPQIFSMLIGSAEIHANAFTGEIINVDKPFFKSLSGILMKMENYTNLLVQKYNDNKIVERVFFPIKLPLKKV